MDKIIAFFMTVISFFMALFGIKFADTYVPGTFPIIEPEAQVEGTVRVMSFNVRCTDVAGVPMTKRTSIVVDEINAVKPDSLGVQEATVAWMNTLEKELTDYAYVGVGRELNDTGEHSAVFYLKDKFELLDSGTFWLSETPDKVSRGWDGACNRVCTWAVLRNKETGEEYVHVNSHYDHQGKEARREGAKLVAGFIAENFAGKNVVFTADMNGNTNNEVYTIMTEGLRDCRFVAEKSEPYGTYHDTKPQFAENRYLDYILCSDGIYVNTYKTVTAGIDGRFVSDHFPIYADITLGKDA